MWTNNKLNLAFLSPYRSQLGQFSFAPQKTLSMEAVVKIVDVAVE